MPHPRRRWLNGIGTSVAVVALGSFLVSRFTREPVSVFLVIPVLVILAVLGLINLFVWRRQRRNQPNQGASRKVRY